jgi:hypothetical protein
MFASLVYLPQHLSGGAVFPSSDIPMRVVTSTPNPTHSCSVTIHHT